MPTANIIELHEKEYLGDYLRARNESLPSGLIDKKYTGIGATTAEIMDTKRNSIIVCPTRALAATKALKEEIHYFGGQWEGVKSAKPKQLLNDIKAGKLVKITVVADSLKSLVKHLGDVAYEKFHLLLDEIDSYQSEASYRPNLQLVVDYYKKFDAARRTMISATVEGFSDPILRAEPVTRIEIDGKEKPNLDTVFCQRDTLASLTNYISNAKEKFPSSKILIALNSIGEIRRTIELLKDQYQNKISVLCSQRSYKKFDRELIGRLNDGYLQTGITFMTSAFFTGIDIMDKDVVLMMVVNTNRQTSLLSPNKLIQIQGRLREKPRHSFLLFNVKSGLNENLRSFIEVIKEKVIFSFDLIKMISSTKAKSIPNVYRNGIVRSVLASSTHRGIKLLYSKDGEVSRAFLNLDYLFQNQKTRNAFSSVFELQRVIRNYFEATVTMDYSTLSKDEIDTVEELDERMRDEVKDNILNFIRLDVDKILTHQPQSTLEEKIIEILTTVEKNDPNLLGQVKDYLEEHLKSSIRISTLNKFHKRVKIYTDKDREELWRLINAYFKIGQRYPVEEILRNVQNIYDAIKKPELFSDEISKETAVQWLKMIYIVKPAKGNYPGQHRIVDHYADHFVFSKIEYDPNDGDIIYITTYDDDGTLIRYSENLGISSPENDAVIESLMEGWGD